MTQRRRSLWQQVPRQALAEQLEDAVAILEAQGLFEAADWARDRAPANVSDRKWCEFCGELIVRTYEPDQAWLKRRFCSHECVGLSRTVNPVWQRQQMFKRRHAAEVERLRAERVAEVLRARAAGETYRSIGCRLGVSRERIRQIEHQGRRAERVNEPSVVSGPVAVVSGPPLAWPSAPVAPTASEWDMIRQARTPEGAVGRFFGDRQLPNIAGLEEAVAMAGLEIEWIEPMADGPWRWRIVAKEGEAIAG